MFLNRKESLFQKTARLQSKKLSPGQGKLIKDLLSFPAITWRDVTRFSNSQITTTTSMGNFLRDRKILCAAILLNEVTAAVCTCAHVNTHTHTHIYIYPVRGAERGRMTISTKGLVYTSTSQLSHPPLQCVRWAAPWLSLSGLMGRSVMHVVRCLASHIHLRRSAACVLHPPHPKHQYLDICTWRNLIHKRRDKQWHRCTHTLSHRHTQTHSHTRTA